MLEDGAVQRILEEVGVDLDAGGAAFGALDQELEDLAFAIGGDGALDAGMAHLVGCGDGLGSGGAAAGDELEAMRSSIPPRRARRWM